jgi:DNA-binding CsgD family transcriptional regulator
MAKTATNASQFSRSPNCFTGHTVQDRLNVESDRLSSQLRGTLDDPAPAALVPPTRSASTLVCRLTEEEWNRLAELLQLTPRERDIVRRLLLGESEARAGLSLGISNHTVHTHLGRIYRKLEVRSAAGLILRVFAAYLEIARDTRHAP